MAWLSTLGGAFSSLGDRTEHCVRNASFSLLTPVHRPAVSERCASGRFSPVPTSRHENILTSRWVRVPIFLLLYQLINVSVSHIHDRLLSKSDNAFRFTENVYVHFGKGTIYPYTGFYTVIIEN